MLSKRLPRRLQPELTCGSFACFQLRREFDQKSGHGGETRAPVPGENRDSMNPLLQYDLVVFVQSLENLSLGPVRNSDVNCHLALALFALSIRDFDGSIAVLVVND